MLLPSCFPVFWPKQASTRSAEMSFFSEHETGALRADIYVPKTEESRPAVLVVHGGGWIGGNRRQLGWIARLLAKQGFVAMAINYRLAPMHKFPAQLDDCRDAVKWLQENAETYHIDEKRIAAWGYSAGGHLAALLAVASPGLKGRHRRWRSIRFSRSYSRQPHVPVLAWRDERREPAHLRSRLAGPFRDENAPAFFMYHGRHDRLVPPIQAIQMLKLLQNAGVTAELAWTETGHARGVFTREVADEALAFLKKHLCEEKIPQDVERVHAAIAPFQRLSPVGFHGCAG